MRATGRSTDATGVGPKHLSLSEVPPFTTSSSDHGGPGVKVRCGPCDGLHLALPVPRVVSKRLLSAPRRSGAFLVT